MPALFNSPRFVVREMRPDELPTLQALFEANPDYFISIGGQHPRTDEAQQEFDELPPSNLGYGRRWFAGVFDRMERLGGLIILVSDLSAKDVWHTALFFLEVPLRGTGAASELHASLEAWAAASGARWLRLGVVVGNTRAERFWLKCGYTTVRTRQIVVANGETRTTRVMVKPLGSGTLAEYLCQVPRERPIRPWRSQKRHVEPMGGQEEMSFVRVRDTAIMMPTPPTTRHAMPTYMGARPAATRPHAMPPTSSTSPIK